MYASTPHRIRDAEWQEADTPNGKVSYHVVTEDTRGRVTIPGGYQDVQEGDILIPASGDTYYVHPAGAFDFLPGNKAENVTNTQSVELDLSAAAYYDPAERSATHVRRYVSALVDAGCTDEARRIVEDERADKNRKTAVPQSYADWESDQPE